MTKTKIHSHTATYFGSTLPPGEGRPQHVHVTTYLSVPGQPPQGQPNRPCIVTLCWVSSAPSGLAPYFSSRLCRQSGIPRPAWSSDLRQSEQTMRTCPTRVQVERPFSYALRGGRGSDGPRRALWGLMWQQARSRRKKTPAIVASGTASCVHMCVLPCAGVITVNNACKSTRQPLPKLHHTRWSKVDASCVRQLPNLNPNSGEKLQHNTMQQNNKRISTEQPICTQHAQQRNTDGSWLKLV